MKTKTSTSRAGDERGIALLIVLLVLLLTAVLAIEIKATAALHLRLAKNKRDDLLMRQAMAGQVEVIKQVLLFDAAENSEESLDDRWNEDKYTQVQGEAEEEDDEADREDPVSSESVSLIVRIEDEARKFNLHSLVADNEENRAHWEQVFIRLLVIYREDYRQGISLSPGDAENLLENLKKWLDRSDDKDIPVPATTHEKRILITPDELLMVKGFTRDILYDLPPDDEGEESIPGLYRYLTLWSNGPINLNTAEAPVVHAMFDSDDRTLADDLMSWLQEDAEDQENDGTTKRNSLSNPQDLMQVPGFDADAIQRNKLGPATVTMRSNTFSIHLSAESSDGIKRQERWVVARNPVGFTTILSEERNDPTYEGESEE